MFFEHLIQMNFLGQGGCSCARDSFFVYVCPFIHTFTGMALRFQVPVYPFSEWGTKQQEFL